MRTLHRALADPTSMGAAIRLPWRTWNDLVTVRTKEMAILAGAPGGGKSMVAANLAVNLTVPTLYCAQDSPGSILSRLAGLTLGLEINTVQNMLADPERQQLLAEKMKDQHPMLVVERGPVTVNRLRDMCMALREWLGVPPPVVIVDNLIDLLVEGHTHHESTFYSSVLPDLKRLALELDVFVLVLHHVTRGGGELHGRGQHPINMNDLLYAGEREARHVWGVYNNGEDEMMLQVLKQQDGPADPGGDLRVGLRWYPRLGRLMSWEDR